MSQNYDEINQKMVKFVPELASPYAKYPMARDRWLEPTEKTPSGRECYLQEPNAGMKEDYVLGRGPLGEGYYSLLCRIAYENLYSRLTHEVPVGCCNCSKEARRRYDEWDDVKRIVFARSKASIPNDGKAAKDAVSHAKSTAQVWHNNLQNEQLVLGGIQFATM